MRAFKRIVAPVALMGVAAALTACGAGSSADVSGAGPTELTVVEPYASPNLGTAGDILYAVAKEEGYFKAENLTVKVAYADGSTAAIQSLAGGTGDIVGASLGNALQAKGQGLPIKVLRGEVVNYPWKMAVAPDSTIQQASDLKGKTVGIISQASESAVFAANFEKQVGLSPSDVKTVEVGSGAAAAQALDSGKVDVLALYDSVYQQLEGQGADFRYLDNPGLFHHVVSIAQVTTAQKLASNKDAIGRYLRAYSKAVVFATVNPAAAVLDSFKAYPDFLAGTTASAALPEAQASLVAYLKSATPSTDPSQWPSGWRDISQAQWNATNRYEINAGLIDEPVARSSAYEPGLNKLAESFDASRVIKQAQNAPRSAQ